MWMKDRYFWTTEWLETPSIALQSTVSEMVRMGHVVRGTMDRTRDVLITKKREEIEKIRGGRDNRRRIVQRNHRVCD